MKKIYVFLLFSLTFLNAYTQNIAVNIVADKSNYLLNQEGYLSVTIENTSASALQIVPQYKLMPLMSLGRSISVTKVDMPAGWNILENSYNAQEGTTLKLSNGTDGGTSSGFGGGTVRTIIIHFITTTPTISEELSNINLFFANGIEPGTTSGVPTTDDNTVDNSSNTGINISSVLPVSYQKELTAILKNSVVELNWITANEDNNKSFMVQKSINGNTFTNLGFVEGKGSKSTYTFVDESPVKGINYYRLEQKDMDGNNSYSNIVTVNFEQSTTIIIFPNPATSQITVKASDLIEIYELSGKLILSKQPVSGTAVINIQKLSGGTYIVKAGKLSSKFIKL